MRERHHTKITTATTSQSSPLRPAQSDYYQQKLPMFAAAFLTMLAAIAVMFASAFSTVLTLVPMLAASNFRMSSPAVEVVACGR